jgi:outer membrane protein, multidrug efflux system
MMRRALAGVLLALAGCAVGPDYKRPSTPMTASFRGQGEREAASFADLPWWEVFGDPALKRLIKHALKSNYDLEDAIARVDMARETARASGAALWPTLGVQAAPAYQRQFIGGISSFVPSDEGAAISSPRYASYLAQGSLSWELDLFGRLRRLREAALADFLASEENRRGVVVSVIGDVAEGYFNLLALDMQLEISRRTVESRLQTLALFQEREAGGVGTGLDVLSEQALVADARATISTLEGQIAQAENQLAFLLGRVPGRIERNSAFLRGASPPEHPSGLPAALLTRRPDVRRAEAELVSANAEVGAALAAIFPNLTLSANAGFQSTSLSNLLSGQSLTYLLTAPFSWALPLLGGAQNWYSYRAQQASYRSAVIGYRRAVLTALGDVANALSAIRTNRDARAHLQEVVRSRSESLQLAKLRLRGGVATYLDVVQAEESLFPAELQLAQTIGAQFASTTQLYRALGGGWQVPSVSMRRETMIRR